MWEAGTWASRSCLLSAWGGTHRGKAGRQADRQTGRQAGRQACRQAGAGACAWEARTTFLMPVAHPINDMDFQVARLQQNKKTFRMFSRRLKGA